MNYTNYVLAIFMPLSILSACKSDRGNAQYQTNKVVPVSVTKVSEEMVSNTLRYPGTVTALDETELRAEVNGYITNIAVADGAFVTKGQKLYEIDRVPYQAARDQAKASLEIAESNLDKIKKDLERYRALDEKQAIAKQILDYAQSDYNNAQAQVNAAKANLVNAETNLSRSVIYAPYSGSVGISLVRKGALVTAGATLLNTISSVNPIAVDVMVSERDISEFIALKDAKNIQADSIISLELPDGNTYEKYGKVMAIDRAVDKNTGTITVRVVYDNPDGKLRVGMNTNVGVAHKTPEPQLLIPYQAVMEQLGQTLVYTVSDSSTATPVKVLLGLKLGDKVVVKEGLSLGQNVIYDGIINLRPHDKVQAEEAHQETAKAN